MTPSMMWRLLCVRLLVRFLSTVTDTLRRWGWLSASDVHLEIVGQLLNGELGTTPEEGDVHEQEEDHADDVQVEIKSLEGQEIIIPSIMIT